MYIIALQLMQQLHRDPNIKTSGICKIRSYPMLPTSFSFIILQKHQKHSLHMHTS